MVELKKAASCGCKCSLYPSAHKAKEYATMNDSSVDTAVLPLPESSRDVLSGILREGAQRLLVQAVEAEVASWIDAHAHLRDQAGHRQVVPYAHLPPRTLPSPTAPPR